jgi:hypothetical protein
MGRQEDLEFLRRAASARVFSGEWARHHLRRPPRGLDLNLAAKLYSRLIARPWDAPDVLRHLVDEHVPVVAQILSKPKAAEAVFAAAFIRDASDPGPALRKSGEALHVLRMFEWSPGARSVGRRVVAGLAIDPRAVRGSQEVVAVFGFDQARHIAVVAADGSAESADILLPLATRALSARDERLERLADWLVPFARSPVLQPFVEALVAADQPRHVRLLLRDFGANARDPHLRFELRSADGQAHFVLQLQTARMPSKRVEVSVERSGVTKRFCWGDAGASRNTLKLNSPRSLDLVPDWISEAAKALAVRWDLKTLVVEGSLRGAPRERARRWFLSGKRRIPK